MPLLAAFMVPHPPMIIPEIGRGSEEPVRGTITAYHQVAREIAGLEPDTIIISSPHAVMYADYFHISPGRKAKGSFAAFRAPDVSFDEKYDEDLVDRISILAMERGFPAGTLGERNRKLDHGTMVPLWFIRQKYSGAKLVRIGLSGLPLSAHYELGQIIAEAVRDTGRRVVFVASGDLSHKLQPDGPYGFAPEGPRYDERIMDVCGRAAFGELLNFDEAFCEKAAECGHRSFVIMAGLFDGISVRAARLSHQDVTGVGYGICTFYPGEKDEGRHFLNEYLKAKEQETIDRLGKADAYVRLARQSVEAYVTTGRAMKMPKDLPPELTRDRAGTFVSIHKLGKLRGCIGTISPVTSCIAKEIIQNAISAASKDPRFDPIREDELKYLEINVDVLGEPEPVSSPEELDVRKYGVIVSCGMRRGLLLPDLEGVDTVEQQIEIAMQKGGIRKTDPYTLQRFEVIRHS